MGRPASPWTAEIDQTIRGMRARGIIWQTIADHFGLSQWTIIVRARKLGMETHKLGRSEDPALVEQVRKLVAEGLSLARIAEKCGVTRYAVESICGRHGIERAVPAASAPQGETRAYTHRSEPLPAGHPTTWSAITAGTSLEGAPSR
jgi:DNA invertase Pin-like site-specific DNA recombinase